MLAHENGRVLGVLMVVRMNGGGERVHTGAHRCHRSRNSDDD